MTNNQDFIDKRIVTKLVVTYITSPKKREVLDVMSRILNFSDEVRSDLGLTPGSPTKQTGWFSGWLSGNTAATTPSSSSTGVSTSDNKNFSDLWIEFLLTEAQKASEENSS